MFQQIIWKRWCIYQVHFRFKCTTLVIKTILLVAHTYLKKCFSWLCRSLVKSSLLCVLARLHHLPNTIFQAPDLSFHSFLLKTVSCCSPESLESLSHVLKPLFSSSTHIFSAESQDFPQRPIFLQHQICMCLLQILNNCSPNTSENVTSNFLFKRPGWKLSPCSQITESQDHLCWKKALRSSSPEVNPALPSHL